MALKVTTRTLTLIQDCLEPVQLTEHRLNAFSEQSPRKDRESDNYVLHPLQFLDRSQCWRHGSIPTRSWALHGFVCGGRKEIGRRELPNTKSVLSPHWTEVYCISPWRKKQNKQKQALPLLHIKPDQNRLPFNPCGYFAVFWWRPAACVSCTVLAHVSYNLINQLINISWNY